MRKNVLLTLAALLVLYVTGYAQKMSYGIKGGLSIPTLTGGNSDNPVNSGYSSSFGPDGSVYGEYHVNKKFSVTVGLEYSSQGGLKDGVQAFYTTPEFIPYLPYPTPQFLYGDFKSEAKLNYVLVPVLAKYTWRMAKRSPFRIYAALGPFAGFLLKAQQDVTQKSDVIYVMNADNTLTPVAQATFGGRNDIKDQLNTFNVGIEGFVGLSYAISQKHAMFIEAGGNYGFMQIQKGNEKGNKTGAALISFGYAYTFQKYKQRGWR